MKWSRVKTEILGLQLFYAILYSVLHRILLLKNLKNNSFYMILLKHIFKIKMGK